MNDTSQPIDQSIDQPIDQNITTPNPKTPIKLRYIILGILCLLAIIIGSVCITIYVTRNNNADNRTNTSKNDNDNNSAEVSTAFKNLTKEDALAFLRAQTNVTGTLPENYVGKEISNAVITNGDTIVSNLKLIYSYSNTKNLKELAIKEYSDSGFASTNNTKKYDDSNFEIAEYDYYAIVTPKRVKEASSCDHGYNNDCDSLLSFKRSYLDYHEEETAPGSYNDAFYLRTKNPDIINYLLRVYTFFPQVGFGKHGNIYSYSFEEQDDKYVLTVNSIGVGSDINLYVRRIAADKSNGNIYTIPTETGFTEIIKSFPITEEELHSLPGYSS